MDAYEKPTLCSTAKSLRTNTAIHDMQPDKENNSPDPGSPGDDGDDGNDVVFLGEQRIPLSMVPPGRFRQLLVAHQERPTLLHANECETNERSLPTVAADSARCQGGR